MAAAAPADKSVVAQSLRGIFKLLWSSRRSSSSITIRRSPSRLPDDDAYMRTIDSMKQDILFALAPC